MRILFLLISCVGSLEAILPPLYNSVEEIRAILDDERLPDALTSGQAILSIKRIDSGYEITSPKYILKVDVNPLPQSMPGPAKFSLTFQEPTLVK